MKKTLITTGIGIVALAGVLVVDGNQIQQNAVKVELQVFEVMDGNTLRYDVKSGDFTYHFWDKKQVESFADNLDTGDDEQTTLVKTIIKSELQANNVDTVINNLKVKKKFNLEPLIISEPQ